jgi:SAM-dependent methyltransferase
MANTEKCRICNNESGNIIHIVKEMQYGTWKDFEYIECANCGCLQIKSYPEDTGIYYPDDYGAHNVKNSDRPGFFIGWLRKQKLKYVLKENKNLIGFLLSLVIKPGFENKMLPAGVKSNSSILDVGSGAGALLLNLRNKGFTDITGTDIFINDDLIYDNNLRIFKKPLNEVEGTFDFIMLNHSLEHMPQQDVVLKNLKRLIKPGGIIMIRIPVKTDYIWKRYGVKWGSIDAPRHFYLHTQKSMEILSARNGFSVEKVIFDSGIFQFYASEQVIRGIPLRSENSYYLNKKSTLFTKSEIKEFQKVSDELNKEFKGDGACFYLKPL